MRYCTECGRPIADDARFCENCGKSVSADPAAVLSCPCCGMPLSSMDVVCPGCGSEIQERTVSAAVSDFSFRLEHADSDAQTLTIIKNFPIPNTKKDIFDFMVLAVTNLEVKERGVGEKTELNPAIADAWLIKAEQCHKKAAILFKNTSDYPHIQALYTQCQQFAQQYRNERNRKKTILAIARNVLVVIGVILMAAALIVDRTGGNSSGIELAAYILLIVSASTLIKRNARLIDYAICAIGGATAILVSFLLENGSAAILAGSIVLIITGTKYIKMLRQK